LEIDADKTISSHTIPFSHNQLVSFLAHQRLMERNSPLCTNA